MKCFVVFSVAACAAILGLADVERPAWQVDGLLPQFRNKKEARQSASRWLWRAGHAGPHEACTFRCAFDVPGPVRKARLAIAADDVGRLWMNGDPTSLAHAGKAVREGRNVLAISVSNVVSSAGLLVFGEIELQDGRKVEVHSDAKTFKVTDGIPADGRSSANRDFFIE